MVSPKYKPAEEVEGVLTNLPEESVNTSNAIEEDKDADVEFINEVWSNVLSGLTAQVVPSQILTLFP